MSAPPGDRTRARPALVRSAATLRTAALAGLLVGAGLALVAAAQPWWRAIGHGVSVSFSGTQASAGLGQALALVALAGMLLALVVSVRGRRILGALLTLAGGGMLVLGVSRPRPAADAVRNQVREVSLADQFALAGTGWPWVYAFAGAVVLGAGLVMLATARRWPARAARFQRPGEELQGDRGGDDPATVWRSMDAGHDPTLDPVDEPGGVTRTADGPDAGPADPSEGVGVRE